MTDSTTRFRSVLVYDGDCPFCSAAALRRLDDAGTVPWEDESAQRFLDAQFGETPFALAFVDSEAERVWLGESAAEELCTRAGVPALVSDLVGDNYESIADAVRRVTGAEGDPDPYHGEFPLSEGAAGAFADLASNAEQTHRPVVGDDARAGRRSRRPASRGEDERKRSEGSAGRDARIRGLGRCGDSSERSERVRESLGRDDGEPRGRSGSDAADGSRGRSSHPRSRSESESKSETGNRTTDDVPSASRRHRRG